MLLSQWDSCRFILLNLCFFRTNRISGPGFSVVAFVMRIILIDSKDQSYNQPVALMWATAELATGMMIICLPSLPGLFQHRRKSQITRSIIMGGSAAPWSLRHSVLYGATSPSLTNIGHDEKGFIGSHYLELVDDAPHDGEVEIEIRDVPRSRAQIVYGASYPPPRGTVLKTVTMAQGRC